MDTASTSEAALKLEIARLTGAINRHKSAGHQPSQSYKGNIYVNPNYRTFPKLVPPRPPTQRPVSRPASRPAPTSSSEKREVVIGGVAFESSGRSLVRKDLPKPAPAPLAKPVTTRPLKQPSYGVYSLRSAAANAARAYKPKSSRTGARPARNMTLKNNVRPYQARKAAKRAKYSDKPCPRFTTTGSCSRGLTCIYQHDPEKIAICWPFLQGTCPNTAETCALSHDPTPERTPLCVHFANNGRCTRDNCPFPHVRVGPRQGVCRDFAVLGYCEKGLDCDKNHVRECPDFAEKGACTTKGCKLPHVIRANRNRKPQAQNAGSSSAEKEKGKSASVSPIEAQHSNPLDSSAGTTDAASSSRPVVSAEDAQIGDEYISLTFHEDDEEESDEEEASEDEEEGDSPTEMDADADGEMHVHG